MTKNELKKQILDRVYLGESRQEIFAHFDAKFPNRSKDIADLIVNIPSLADRKRYFPHQLAILILLSISILLKFFVAFAVAELSTVLAVIIALIFPAINIILIIGIVKWRPQYFQFLAYFLGFNVFRFLSLNFEFGVDIYQGGIQNGIGGAYQIIEVGILVLIGILSYYVGSQLKRKYQASAKQTKDAQGRIRTQYTIKFLE